MIFCLVGLVFLLCKIVIFSRKSGRRAIFVFFGGGFGLCDLWRISGCLVRFVVCVDIKIVKKFFYNFFRKFQIFL